MIKKPIVLDNFLDPLYVDKIEDSLLGVQYPWFFVCDIAKKASPSQALAKSNYGFSHLLFGEGKVQSIYYNHLSPIVNEACQKISFNPSGIIKARSFLHIPVPKENKSVHDKIHTDSMEPHLVCLYYVNDSQGETLLFDKTNDQLNRYFADIKEDGLICVKRVEPKKGRVLLFDGRIFHCSTPPDTQPRCVINFNVV